MRLSGTHWLPHCTFSPCHPPPFALPLQVPLSVTIRSGGNRAWVILAMFSRENWKEKLNMRKSWKMAGQSRGQMSCCPLKVEMVMESVQKEQGCMPVKPPSMYRCGRQREKCSPGVRGPPPVPGVHQGNGPIRISLETKVQVGKRHACGHSVSPRWPVDSQPSALSLYCLSSAILLGLRWGPQASMRRGISIH